MTRALLACLAFACLTACSAAGVRATHVTVVTLGGAVTSLRSANALAYQRATDDLIARLAADGGTSADYARLAAPMTADFRARSDALVALATSLYAAAAINDAVRSGGSLASLRGAGREVLDATRVVLEVLERQGALPPLAVPPEVRGVLATLRGFLGDAETDAGGGHDGG